MADAWKPYIDHMMAAGVQIGGIYGQDGNVWAVSTAMKATQPEVANIVNMIRTQNFDAGVYIAGQKYTVIRTASDSVTAKRKESAKEDEKYLVHCCLGKTCILIGGICGAGERECTKKVEDLRDYLAQSNY